MEELIKSVATQVPALITLVWLVWMRDKTLRQIATDQQKKHSELTQTVTKALDKNSDSNLENAKITGQVLEALRRFNGNSKKKSA